jgi:hypothetical protein
VNDSKSAKGFAGLLAEAFVKSKLTPLIALLSILFGIGAVWLTPKEEDPQISLPMIDILTEARRRDPDLPVILMTAQAELKTLQAGLT